jgi:hypothetical protein
MGASCAICGRTILAGERVHGYYEGDEERTVCELCVARAERLAWRPADEPEPERPGYRHEGRLRGLRRRPQLPLNDSAPTPFERAVARFNSSEAGRTVIGLTRTLGTPRASVGASAGAPGEVRITVAWELSWYQWGVDLGDESRPVFELDKGGEIDQIDSSGRQWNASATENGRVILTTSANGHAGEPLSR